MPEPTERAPAMERVSPPSARAEPIDPTENVIALVNGEVRRLDDMRNLVADYAEKMAVMRADHESELRQAESDRLDAIRAVDVGAVNRAAEVSATTAGTLAAQVAQSAETLRTQVAATATAGAIALAAALEPIRKDIADLRQVQYEGAGAKNRGTETRLNYGAILGGVSVLLVIIFGLIAVFKK